MSVFNQSRYNLTNFNIEGQNVTYLTADLVERVASVTASGAEYMLTSVLMERIAQDAIIAKGFIAKADGTESVTQQAAGNRYFKLRAGGTEFLSQAGTIAAIYSLAASPAEAISRSISIAEYVLALASMSENIGQNTAISQKILQSSDLNEMVDVTADVEATEEYVCSLDIVIPPGSTLIIDAINYNVFLDGENVVYAHSGAWLDEMNRMTQSIRITGTRTANLAANIMYTERFL